MAFGLRSKKVSMRPFMEAAGNAMAESLLATLERKLLNQHRSTSQAKARMTRFSVIEGFHNPVRPISSPAYRSSFHYDQESQAKSHSAKP